ncbi:putative reverse transcriptase domain-containing protein [Tanacetum coccineum]
MSNNGTWPSFECGGTDHFKAACPRLNQAQRPEGNRPNQAVANNGGQDCGNNGNQARGRVFMLGAEEARQDPNIMTGTFTLNNHYAMTLFDSGADYSFVFTTFIPLLDIEPNNLGFSYEIEIVSGQLVDITKVIRGCKLEIEGHVFDINLIPFGHGSFDMIIGMDWLSKHKAEIVCHEKVVRIPLQKGKVLRVIGESLEEKVRHLMSAKAKEQKQEEIVVVRNFPEVFSDDLSGLPRQLRELQDKGFIRLSSSPWGAPIEAVKNWEAPRTPSEVHSFIGLAWYYRRFIENFSKIAKSLTILTQKCKTFDWGEEQELAFQTLKDKLCNAPVLALPDGPEDFVVYCDASGLGLGCVLMQRGKVITYASRQLKIYEKNYTTHDLELGADFYLSRSGDTTCTGRRADYDCKMRYHPGKANMVADALMAQTEASDEPAEMQRGLDELIGHRSDRALYYLDRIWVPLKGDVRTLIMDEAHKSKYSVHPGADKMYYDLRDMYWWSGMKKDIAFYERIAMDFVTKLPRTSSGHEAIWVIVDRLTKSAHFLPMREDYKMDRLARLYLNEIVARHGDEVGEGQPIGPELVQETTKKISQIKDRLKAARDRQKSFADKRRKPLEFSVGEYVLLKVSPWKGVIPLDEIQVDAKLNFVEELMEILEREFKKLKQSRIAIVKVRWNSKRGPEFTWERKDQMKLKYPHLFSSSTS